MSFTLNPNVKKALLQAALNGLAEVGQDILNRSIPITPLDERPTRNNVVLIDTAAVTVVENENAVYVSYDTIYAVDQHENQDYYHPAPRRSKYLYVPFTETPMDKVLKTIGKEIDSL